MDSYQHGKPHRLNPKTRPKAVEFDRMPEVKVNKPPPIHLPNGDLGTTKDFVNRLKYEVAKLA